ncbi:hypothetical protein PINS_up003138 [Pythium insidiosum]|nr:hypothetical protein PINS_up003138 [Pythium insidiosum]
MRQFEVLRRDARIQEKKHIDEIERLQKELEDARLESSESAALNEELQTKMTSVQNAANATINELMSELQSARDTMAFEKNKWSKEAESLKHQVRVLEDDLRRKDSELKELHGAFKHEKEAFGDKESELLLRLSRISTTLDAKKNEVDKLTRDFEQKSLKVAEYERKLNPIINARDNLQSKCTELKQNLDSKIRECHELEERYRDEISRLTKEKRDIEAMYVTVKEELELSRTQANGQHHQWGNEIRSLKQQLERTKAELVRASAESHALSQRLEAVQASANDTIADLSVRLQGADQAKDLAVQALHREINLERERRREAEVQKMELQRQLRHLNQASQPESKTAQKNDDGWKPASSPPPTRQLQEPEGVDVSNTLHEKADQGRQSLETIQFQVLDASRVS